LIEMAKVKSRTHYERYYEDDDIVEEVMHSMSLYDEDGNLTEIRMYSPDGEIIHVETHEYENGKEVRSLQEDLVNEATQKSEFVYQDDLLQIQRDYFTDEDFIETRYSYDDQKRIVEIRKTDNDNLSQGYTT